MDKTLFKAYVRTIVEEEVRKILPDILNEAVVEIKKTQLTESSSSPVDKKPSIDRSRMAELLGITRDGDTLRAETNNINRVPQDRIGKVNSAVEEAINRDYSDLMKAMKITR